MVSRLRTIGSLLILFIITSASSDNSLRAYAEIRTQPKIKIAFYIGAGAHPRPQAHKVLSAQSDFFLEEVNGADIACGALRHFDLLLVPGGSGRVEANSLGEAGREAVRQFVASGGGYIGICAGCYLASGGLPTYLGILPADLIDRTHRHWRRGKATLKLEVTPFGHEVLGVKDEQIAVIYHNGPVMKQSTTCGEGKLTPLAIFQDEVVAPGAQPGLMIGSPAMVLASYHKGIVIGISPHPEATPGLQNLLPHAIRWVCSHQER